MVQGNAGAPGTAMASVARVVVNIEASVRAACTQRPDLMRSAIAKHLDDLVITVCVRAVCAGSYGGCVLDHFCWCECDLFCLRICSGVRVDAFQPKSITHALARQATLQFSIAKSYIV